MSFWEGKKVLLTGHTGFKGSWLSELLLYRGSKVYGLALQPDTTPALFTQLALDQRIDHFVCDVRDADKVARRIHSVRPDILIHMAAQALVRRSYECPRLTFATNIMGTVHVLEALRCLSKRCAVVVITSDKVYKDVKSKSSKRETDQLGGFEPYSVSKVATELMIDCYRHSFFANRFRTKGDIVIATARSGNVLGGGGLGRRQAPAGSGKSISC